MLERYASLFRQRVSDEGEIGLTVLPAVAARQRVVHEGGAQSRLSWWENTHFKQRLFERPL